MTPNDPSQDGSEAVNSGDTMHPVEPTQAELDADMAANPDTSVQVDGADRDAGGGGGGGGGTG